MVNFRKFTIPRRCESHKYRQAQLLHRRLQEKRMPSRSAHCSDEATVLMPLSLSPPPCPSSASWGWQDLREECIKLKKRVFDLERQNQMLSALFQQKLQLTAGSLPQVGTRDSPSFLTSQPQTSQPALSSSSPQKQVVSHWPPFWALWPSRAGPPRLIDLSLR